MLAILHSVGMFVADLFKSRCRLEAENLFLRHQLSIALRRAPPRLRLRGRTCGEFLLRMQRITITRARTWRWARMRRWVGRSSGPVSLSLSQSWPGCTTNTSGYDFQKGQDHNDKSASQFDPDRRHYSAAALIFQFEVRSPLFSYM